MVHIIGENNSLFNKFIAEIRDVEIQKDSLRFRRNIERVGEIFSYEISKTLDYSKTTVQTPLAELEMDLYDNNVVVASILRAGLPLHNGFLNYFDNSENAFISAYRNYNEKGEFVVNIEYISSPSIDDKIVMLVDPMLATGSSMELAYQAILTKGTPKHVHIVSIFACEEGLKFVQEHINDENVTFWMGVVDPILNPQSYIIPGCGDAGDLAYGTKL